MKRTIVTFLAGFLSLAAVASASVTIEIDAGILRGASPTSVVPTGGLLMLVASPSGSASNFSAPTSTSFVTGDNVIVAAFGMNYNGGVTGEVDYSPNFSLANTGTPSPTTFDQGDPLLLRWYPTLTYADYAAGSLTAPGIGTIYGQGRSTTAADGASSAWITPANSTSSTVLTFITPDDAGSQAAGSGLASNVVFAAPVPEPSTAMFLGATALGLAGTYLRRRRS